VRADRLAAELGLGEVWVKNDTVNPTNSFKDRVTTVALAKALEFGFKVAACASTGNLANAVAAHAAHAGLRSFVFIPSNLEQGKIVTTAVYGGNVVAIDGNYDAVNRLCAELAGMYPWAFVNVNVRTYYAEGSKTLAFETAEQLGWEVPDHVVVPVASGSLLTKIRKGFDELFRVGLLETEPQVRVSGAQAAGCSPVAAAWLDESDTIKPVKPDTIAKSLAIGNPADGYFALDAVRQTGGGLAAVSDEEVVDAMLLLARTEGIFAETAGGVTVATLKRLAEQGIVRPDERVVVYITGHGLKTLDAVVDRSGADTIVIEPSLDAFHEVFPPETVRE
jgi:threonine synthase